MTGQQEENSCGSVAVVASCCLSSNSEQLKAIASLIEMASKRINDRHVMESADLKVMSTWLKVALDYTDDLIERCKDAK